MLPPETGTNSCYASASKEHFVKSISSPHPLQVCFLSNSSEKISVSFPQLGHLQTKDCKCLNASKPGQCCGVVIIETPKIYYSLISCPGHLLFTIYLPCHAPGKWYFFRMGICHLFVIFSACNSNNQSPGKNQAYR